MSGPRSNFSLLDFSIRFRVITMLHDGATAEAIAADPEIARAYQDRGLKLTRSALSRVKNTKEYRDITAKRLQAVQSREADRLTAALLKEQQATVSLGEQAAVELMEAIRANVHLAEDSKEVERLVRCVTALNNGSRDQKIQELQRRLEDAEARYEARERELLEQIRQLQSQGGSGDASGMSAQTLAAVEDKIKLL